jgi:enoyl-[acyl-carrier-protein] reductase (NADH)
MAPPCLSTAATPCALSSLRAPQRHSPALRWPQELPPPTDRIRARAHLVKADVRTPEGCAALADAVRSKGVVLDQVVHSPADACATTTLGADPLRFANALATNGRSLLSLVQATLPLLRRGSRVFYLTSRGGRIVVPNYAAVGNSLPSALATKSSPQTLV